MGRVWDFALPWGLGWVTKINFFLLFSDLFLKNYHYCYPIYCTQSNKMSH